VAIAALEAAELNVSDDAVAGGLRETHWPGRFQIVTERLVLDGCHNPHAASHLVLNWRDAFGAEKATIIFGALADKDFSAMLEILAPVGREMCFVPVRSERSAAPETLASVCPLATRVFASVKEALDATQGRTLVTGSLFLVGEVLELLGFEP
jgi:dihydrofolate synthase/folylpolyglutamate synthase